MFSDMLPILAFVPMYLLAGYISAWVLFKVVPWSFVRAILLVPMILLTSFGELMLLGLVFPTIGLGGGIVAFVGAVPGLPAALAVSIFLLKSWDKEQADLVSKAKASIR